MKRWIIGSLFFTAAFGIVLTSGEQAAAQKKSETIKLFNGKDLDGWEGYTDLFSVKDGVIVAKNEKPLKYSTYLFTKQKFTDFRLVFSAKLVTSEMHSGVAIWGKKFLPKDVKDAVAEKAEHTYQGHLVMFPSGWGLFDLYRRNGLMCRRKPFRPKRKPASSTTGMTWRFSRSGIAFAWPSMVRRCLIGAIRSRNWSAKDRLRLQLHSNGVPQEDPSSSGAGSDDVPGR